MDLNWIHSGSHGVGETHTKAACKQLQAALISQKQGGLHCRWFVFAFLLGEQQTQDHGGYAH